MRKLTHLSTISAWHISRIQKHRLMRRKASCSFICTIDDFSWHTCIMLGFTIYLLFILPSSSLMPLLSRRRSDVAGAMHPHGAGANSTSSFGSRSMPQRGVARVVSYQVCLCMHMCIAHKCLIKKGENFYFFFWCFHVDE